MKKRLAALVFENYDPSTAVAEETDAGLRELDPNGAVPMRRSSLRIWTRSSLMPSGERTADGILAFGGPNAIHFPTTVEMRGERQMNLADINVWSVQAASRHHPFCRRIEVPSC
jgi:hypothetical protein